MGPAVGAVGERLWCEGSPLREEARMHSLTTCCAQFVGGLSPLTLN